MSSLITLIDNDPEPVISLRLVPPSGEHGDGFSIDQVSGLVAELGEVAARARRVRDAAASRRGV